MADPFDVGALIGRPFGDVLDEIAPGWRTWGLGPSGPFGVPIGGGVQPQTEEEIRRNTEIRRKVALIVAALREGTVDLVTIAGVVPRQVWFEGGWGVFRNDEQAVEWLQVLTETGQRVRRFCPTFRAPAAEGIGRTGTAGRPTSWHLVEAECRRRYKRGERHPGKKGESPTEWARILISWLRKEHETAPLPGESAARNNLSPLLRKLEKECLK